MRQSLMVRVISIGNDDRAVNDAQLEWAIYGEDEWEHLPTTGSVAQFKHFITQRNTLLLNNIWLILPTEVVTLVTVEVPNVKSKHLLKAIPYALEDQILEDVETQHFSLGIRQSDSLVTTAVINKQLLSDWMAFCHHLQLYPSKVVPDVLLVPWDNQQNTILLDHDRILLRTGEASGVAFPITQWPTLLHVLKSQHVLDEQQNQVSTKTNNIRLIYCQDSIEDEYSQIKKVTELQQLAKQQGLPLTCEQFHGSLYKLFYNAIFFPAPINLLQGEFKKKIKFSPLQFKIKPLVYSCLLLFCITLITWTTKGWYYNYKAEQQQINAEQKFLQLFPETKRIVSLRRQLQAKISNHQKIGDDIQFTQHFTLIAQALVELNKNNKNNVLLRQLNFDSKKKHIKLKLEVLNFKIIEHLEASLKKFQYKISTDAVNQENNRINYSMTLEIT